MNSQPAKRSITKQAKYQTLADEDFKKSWNKYSREIVVKTNYPEAFKLKGELKEISKEFDLANSGVKIGKTTHANGTFLYHVFINVNYRIKITS